MEVMIKSLSLSRIESRFSCCPTHCLSKVPGYSISEIKKETHQYYNSISRHSSSRECLMYKVQHMQINLPVSPVASSV